jgi:hypothetical protein
LGFSSGTSMVRPGFNKSGAVLLLHCAIGPFCVRLHHGLISARWFTHSWKAIVPARSSGRPQLHDQDTLGRGPLQQESPATTCIQQQQQNLHISSMRQYGVATAHVNQTMLVLLVACRQRHLQLVLRGWFGPLTPSAQQQSCGQLSVPRLLTWGTQAEILSLDMAWCRPWRLTSIC